MLQTTAETRIHMRHVASRLAQFGASFDQCLSALQGLADDPHLVPRRTDITDQFSGWPEIVVSGWACTMRLDSHGKRQIFGFILPGDVLGSFWRRPHFVFCRQATLTRLTAVPAVALMALDAGGAWRHPEVVRAARRAEDHAQHLLIDHVVRIGSRDAYAGLAHLFLEFHTRLDRVGLVRDGAFRLPVGQRVLAEAMGFSVVHTNHTLQRMVADKLFMVERETVRLLQPERMAALSGFASRAAADPAVVALSMDGLDHEPQVHRHDQGA